MEQTIIQEKKRDYAVLVGLRSPVLGDDSADEESLAELAALVDTAGGQAVGTILQSRDKPDPHSFIGEGKVEEVRRMVQEENATMVIFDNDLSPSQLRVLTEMTGVQVLDRSGLILDIFAQRARTREGRLQVELAQYQYLLPRLIGMWTHLERQAGTSGKGPIGSKGPGETQLETDRRHIHRKIDKLKADLEEVRRVRGTQRQRRQKNEIPVVAIVGYTNAGKSTLLNRLTQAGILAEDKLFDCAKKQVAALEAEGCDYIVCLGHLGIDDESTGNRSIDLLKKVSGIDVFIDGHSHSTLGEVTAAAEAAGITGTAVTSTGTKLENVGVVTINGESISATVTALADLTAEDADIAARAAAIQKEIDDDYGTVFAKTEVALNGEKDPGNRTEETNLGDLICDALVWGAKKNGETVDAAVTNGGGIRASIAAGNITKKDINTVLPFGNTLGIVKVTGAELLEALEASTFALPKSLGGFPQIAGMNISIDATKKYDANADTYPGSTYHGPASINRVTINSVNGKAFDPNKTYAVVTNNFLAAGGDTYYAFAAASGQFDTGLPLDEVLMDYITTELKGVVGEQYAQPQGRITITLPAEEPTTPTKPESPKTADTGVVVYGLVAVMAAGAAVVVTSRKRKAI